MLYIIKNVFKPNFVQNSLYEVKIDEFFAFKIALTRLKCSMLICFFLTSKHVIPTDTAIAGQQSANTNLFLIHNGPLLKLFRHKWNMWGGR